MGRECLYINHIWAKLLLLPLLAQTYRHPIHSELFGEEVREYGVLEKLFCIVDHDVC